MLNLTSRAERLTTSGSILPLLVIAIGLALATVVTYVTGGTHRAFPHLYYIPIIGAAYFFGLRGGIAVGILSTFLCGPLMPLDVESGQMQVTQNWLSRGVFFLAIGIISGAGAASLRSRIGRVQRLHEEAVTSFVMTIDAKSPYTARHSERVAELAVAIGQGMQLNDADLAHLRWAALLHDVGKLWIPASILDKRGPLSEHEWEQIRAHPVHSQEFLANITEFDRYLPAARHHHERWDGRGYPDGLSGYEIPLDARIIAAADAFEAMTSSRPYRPGLTFEEARTEVQTNAGTQFDPAVAKALLLALDSYPSLLVHPLQPPAHTRAKAG